MKNVFDFIQQHQVNVATLPEDIRQGLADYRELCIAYNEMATEHDKHGGEDAEAETAIEDLQTQLQSRSDELIEDITEFLDDQAADTPPATESKGGTTLMLACFFGLLTLGAVNLFKNR